MPSIPANCPTALLVSMPRIECLLLCCVFLGGCQTATVSRPDASRDSKSAKTHVERGPVRVQLEVSPEPARLSDEPQLTVTIEYEPGIEVLKPPFGTSTGAFIVRNFREPLPQTDGKRHVLQQIYRLEPTQLGPSQIDPVVIKFIDKRPNGDGKEHVLETESLTVQVISPLGSQSPSLAALKGPQGPVALPSPGLSGWVWAAISGSVALLALIGWQLFARHRSAVQTPPSARELAERELMALWKSKVPRTEVKRFYVELTGIVRRYIERTTTVHAPEQTTEEFLREITHVSSFTSDDRQRLKSFLEAADLVKFAAHEPMFSDIEESFRRAKVFVGLRAAGGQPV